MSRWHAWGTKGSRYLRWKGLLSSLRLTNGQDNECQVGDAMTGNGHHKQYRFIMPLVVVVAITFLSFFSSESCFLVFYPHGRTLSDEYERWKENDLNLITFDFLPRRRALIRCRNRFMRWINKWMNDKYEFKEGLKSLCAALKPRIEENPKEKQAVPANRPWPQEHLSQCLA